MGKRLLNLLLLLAVLMFVLVSCGDSSDEGSEDVSVEVTEEDDDEVDVVEETGRDDVDSVANGDLLVYGIYKAGDQTWFIDEGEAAKNAVEAAGGEFVYVDANMDPEEYLNAMDNAIGYFVVDNVEELYAINQEAKKRNIKQDILLRITPGIDPDTLEAITTGSLAGYNSARYVLNKELLELPVELAVGDFISYGNRVIQTEEGLRDKIGRAHV